MKKKLKQLFAVVMAVAMVLSLSVTALATASEQPGTDTNIDSTDGTAFSYVTTNSGEVVTDTGDTDANYPASGGIKAESRSEGPLPDDPVEIIFPTIPANPGRDDGITSNNTSSFTIYDVILDPHSLINATDAARYTVSGGNVKKNFSDTSRLYFLTDFTATEHTYDGESYPLMITNKGRQPVCVNLSLNFDYDDAYVTLVNSKSGLKMTSGDTVNSDVGAQMYFALKAGAGDKETVIPVADPATNAKPFITVSGRGDYLKARTSSSDSVDFAWKIASATSGDSMVFDNATITISYHAPETLVSGGALQTGSIQAVMAGLDSAYSIVSGDQTVTSGGKITFTVKSGDATNGTDFAEIKVDVKDPNPRKMKEDASGAYDQTIQFKTRQTGVILETAIEGNVDKYEEQWVEPGTLTTEPQGITDNGYYWDLKDDYKNAEKPQEVFPTLTFKLEGDINNDDMWDAWSAEPQVNFVLIWDVMQKSTYYNDVTYRNGAVDTAGSATEPTLDEVVKMTNTTTGKNLTISYTPGTGKYAAYVPSATVKTSNNKTLTMTVDTTAHTLYMANAYATVATNGATATVTFTDPNGVLPDLPLTTTALR